MKNKVKILAVIILLGVAYAGYDFYCFYSEELPKMETAQRDAEGVLAKKQSELRQLQEFAQNIEVVKQELRELNLQLESALEHMPRNFNLSGLLRKLTMLAQNSGLELSSFRPSDKEERVEGAFYSVITINFDLKGSYTQTLVFFDQVSRLKRIINIDQVTMDVPENNQQRAGSLVLNTKVAVRTYRFSE